MGFGRCLLRHRRGGAGGDCQKDEQDGKERGQAVVFFAFQYVHNAYLRIAFKAKGEHAAALLRVEQRMGIGGAGGGVLLPERALVAEQLEVASREPHHHPHERVEPVDTERRGEKHFLEDVQPADVRELVGQNRL